AGGGPVRRHHRPAAGHHRPTRQRAAVLPPAPAPQTPPGRLGHQPHRTVRPHRKAMTAATTTLPHPSFRGLSAVDWDTTGGILRHATPIFDAFATEHDLLTGLLDNLERDEHLRPMCEGYDFMDKLVLHDDTATQVRVRLHLYRAGYFDRPHNHRWS